MADVIFAPGFDQRPTQGLGRIGEALMAWALQRQKMVMNREQVELQKKQLMQEQKKAELAESARREAQNVGLYGTPAPVQSMTAEIQSNPALFGRQPNLMPGPIGTPFGGTMLPTPPSPLQMAAQTATQDYLRMVGNAQAGSSMVDTAAGRALVAVQKLKLNDEDEYMGRAARQLLAPESVKRFDQMRALKKLGWKLEDMKGMLTETEMERLDREKTWYEVQNAKDKRLGDIAATTHLKKWGKIPQTAPEATEGAMAMLMDLRKSDHAAANQRRTDERQLLEASAEGTALDLALKGAAQDTIKVALGRAYPLLTDGQRAKIAHGARAEAAKPLGGAPSDYERRAYYFLGPTERAFETLERLAAKNVVPSPTDMGLQRLPFSIGQGFIDDDTQMLLNAGEVFTETLLRIATGATIAKDEARREALQYLPLPGDTEELRQEKSRLRAIALERVRQAAGRAKNGLGGQPYSPGNKFAPR